MRCEDLENYVADYIDNCLEENVRSQVQQHLELCPRCREEAESLRDVSIQGRAISIAPTDSSAMRSTFHSMLSTYKQGMHRSRPSPRRQLIQVLVAIVLLGIAVFAAQRTGLIVMRAPVAVKAPEPVSAPTPPQVETVPAKGSIEGLVLRAGSIEPIAGAQVSAFWAITPAAYSPEAVPRALTDREGRFIISDLAPGGYRVYVSARTYSPQAYGRKEAGPVGAGTETILEVTPGKAIKDVVVRLTPAGVISGRILSEKGEPLLGMEVVVLRSIYDAHGWRSLTAETIRGLTNDRGEYRVPGISPGKYYVRASSAAEINGNMEVTQRQYIGLPAPFSYGKFQTVYYPHEADVSKASLIEMREGDERTNVDFVLSRQFENRRVRGRVIDPTGAPIPPRTNVRLDPYGVFVSSIGGGVTADSEGTFDIHDVLPGNYWLVAMLPSAPSPVQQLLKTSKVDFSELTPPPRGLTRITVGDSNIDDVAVTVARDLSVTGRITVEGEPPPALLHVENMKIEFLQVSASGLGSNIPAGNVETGGAFTYKSIWPGEYLVWFSGLPADAYIKEARLGDRDVLKETVLITEPLTGELKVILGSKGGAVGGMITDRGTAVPGKQVVLIPSEPTTQRNLFKTATTDRNGRFEFRGIAPGDYKLFAWNAIESYRYFDPAFVKEFEMQGTTVHVSEATSVTATVKLIRASDPQ